MLGSNPTSANSSLAVGLWDSHLTTLCLSFPSVPHRREDETSENAPDVSEVGLLKEQKKDSGREEADVGAGPVHGGPYRPRQSLDFVNRQ